MGLDNYNPLKNNLNQIARQPYAFGNVGVPASTFADWAAYGISFKTDKLAVSNGRITTAAQALLDNLNAPYTPPAHRDIQDVPIIQEALLSADDERAGNRELHNIISVGNSGMNVSETSPGEYEYRNMHNDNVVYAEDDKYNPVTMKPFNDKLNKPSAMTLDFDIPDWGVPDYINERTVWQKSLYEMTNEPGWFYFKIFFKFNTNYGLFGGIMNDSDGRTFASSNSAAQYLFMNQKWYKPENLTQRMLALYKFTAMLCYLSSQAPWYFIGVSNLNNAYNNYLADFSKEKSIDIECMPDSVDMRMNMLFDLYKYACFDNIQCKEIIPENLRKFDMTIMVYNVPIKYYHTGNMVSNDSFQFYNNKGNKFLGGVNKALSALNSDEQQYNPYRKMINVQAHDGVNSTPFANAMSWQMFTFKNCEFDVESMGNYYKTSLSNEKPIQLGKNTIKVTYDRCYKHHLNEWNKVMFGSDGFYYSADIPNIWMTPEMDESLTSLKDKSYYAGVTQDERLKSIQQGLEARYYNQELDNYQGIIEFSEYYIRDALRNMSFRNDPAFAFTKGNLYGDYHNMIEYIRHNFNILKGNLFKKNDAPREDAAEKHKSNFWSFIPGH